MYGCGWSASREVTTILMFVSEGVQRALDTSVGAMSYQPASGKLDRDNQSSLAAARLKHYASVVNISLVLFTV